ncbi:hypothetical protein [Variovorax guangxiensis]|uniref:Uncharacterized protein n=1 Tax=Variovorax guangxiensis TaxID=1775474 RepID=A0A502DFK0_9BURK|nr:hypothetical protein [Variovorax guangxiensis]TPG23460.1 hypothetical protein EAH82_20565 [Variovorax guangxiensis]TPG24081.1 hypothetical protein EAH83_06155 [Variovorax ginsengisoli]
MPIVLENAEHLTDKDLADLRDDGQLGDGHDFARVPPVAFESVKDAPNLGPSYQELSQFCTFRHG